MADRPVARGDRLLIEHRSTGVFIYLHMEIFCFFVSRMVTVTICATETKNDDAASRKQLCTVISDSDSDLRDLVS